MWTFLFILLSVSSMPPAPPLFGYQVQAPITFESESACREFLKMMRKEIAKTGLRETTMDAPPGYVMGDCVPVAQRMPAKAVHDP